MRRNQAVAPLLCRTIRALILGLALGLTLIPGPGTAQMPGPASARVDEGGPGQRIQLTTTKARQLSMPVDVRDVVIADPTVADVLIKTPRLVYLIGSKVGDTNAIFLDANGRQVLKLDIRVDRDLSALRGALTQLVPGTDIRVVTLGQDLVVSGDVPSAAAADTVRQLVRRFVDKDDSLVNMLKVTGSQQVVIRVKVAEVRRTVTKRLGLDFSDTGSRFRLGLAGGTTTSVNPISAIANTFTDRFAVGALNWGGNQFRSAIEALEENGLIKVLAEPNLTAVSGEPASFLAGGEFPVPTGRDQNNNVTISFRPFGVSLVFTPVVLGNGRINLRIGTEVSELSTQGAIVLDSISIPALEVRRAQTTVEIPSGGSLMLGGLLRNDVQSTVRGLPGLKDVPILGSLFRSNNFLSNETELVVIATPYIVRPAAAAAMTAPTDGFAPPTDLDRYFLNSLYARYGAGSKAPPRSERPVGYIIR
ncbi:MAG: type II and III secretion system protein family protein [Rhodospirillaceae bacterium]